MTITAATLDIRIRGDASSATKAIDGFSKKVEGMSSSLKGIGTKLTGAVTAPLVGFGALSIKTAADFEQAMANVGAVAGASAGEMDTLTKAAEDLGRTTSFSASEAAEGMKFLAQAGFETSSIVEAMPGLLNAAAASAEDLGTTADIVSNVLSGFGKDASETGAVADVLVSTLTSSNTDMRQLGDAMKYVAPVAASLGLSIEDTAAAIGTMSDAGIQASQAGTALRGILSRLAAPTGEAANLIEDLGINAFDTQGNLKDIGGVLSEFEQGLAGMSAQQRQAALSTIVGTEAASGFLALLARGSEGVSGFSDAIKNDVGIASETAAKQLETMQGQIKLFRSAFEGLQIAVGNAFLPVLTEGITKITPLISRMAEGFANLSPAMKRTIVIFGSIAAVIGPVLIAIGALLPAIAAIGPIFSAVGVAIAAVGPIFAAVGAAIAAIGAPAIAAAAAIGVLLGAMYHYDIGGFRTAIDGVVEAIKNLAANSSFKWEPDFKQIKLGDLFSFVSSSGATKINIGDWFTFTGFGSFKRFTLGDFFEFVTGAGSTRVNIADWFVFNYEKGFAKFTLGDFFSFRSGDDATQINIADWFNFSIVQGFTKFTLGDFFSFMSGDGATQINIGEWFTFSLTESITRLTLGDFFTFVSEGGTGVVNVGDWFNFRINYAPLTAAFTNIQTAANKTKTIFANMFTGENGKFELPSLSELGAGLASLGALAQTTADEIKAVLSKAFEFDFSSLAPVALGDIFPFLADGEIDFFGLFTFDVSKISKITLEDIFPFLAEDVSLSDVFNLDNISVPQWVTDLMNFTWPSLADISAPEWLTGFLNAEFEVPEFPEWKAPAWLMGLLEFKLPSFENLAAPEWLMNLADVTLPDFNNMQAPGWLQALFDFTWPAIAALTAPVWLGPLLVWKWPEITALIAPYWFDFLENFAWPDISIMNAPAWLTGLLDFKFPDISGWKAPEWITSLTTFSWPSFDIQKPQWLDDLLTFDVSRLNPFSNKNKQTEDEIQFSIPALDTSTFQSLLAELNAFMWPTPDLTALNSALSGLGAVNWNTPGAEDLKVINITIDRVAALQWPEFPAQPPWIQTLMGWLWPDPPAQPDWVKTLFGWDWPDFPKEPGWVDDLTKWSWPDFPSEPGWVDDLVNWDWPEPPSSGPETPSTPADTVAASSLDLSALQLAAPAATTQIEAINIAVTAQSIDRENIDDLAYLLVERMKFEMAR